PIALAHRRLSIIDIEGGAQPMESSTGRTVICYNGEVYNSPGLRETLRGLGYRFRTHSDTEVILAAYEAWGTDSFERLHGMYAFALYDRTKGRVFLVRDPMGIKPLYVCERESTLFFASEIKAIRAVVGRLDLNHEAVNAFFLRQYIGGPQTVFEDIYSVAPGTYRELRWNDDDRRAVERTFYRLEARRPESISLQNAAETLDQELHRVIKEHMLADVPVGLFLSGGLDSSLLLGLASDVIEEPLSTFSVGFGDASVDETRYARFVAESSGANHHELRVAATEGLSVLPEIVEHMDQPLADYAIVPTYVMSRFAAEHVKVVLGGEGADELFGGYWKRYLPSLLVSPFGGRLSPPTVYGPMLFRERARRDLLGERYVRATSLPSEQRLRADLRYFSLGGAVNAALHTDLRNWLVDDLLMKVDKMGMLASIEARVPYLDRGLVETVAGWPGGVKLGWRGTKQVLRHLGAKRLPGPIAKRPKHGFTVPVGQWFRDGLRAEFEDRVFGGGLSDEWLHRPAVEGLWHEHQAGRDRGLLLWSVFIFAWWLDTHQSPGQAAHGAT
ncbi:MAG: asparagine synthase (glutamine-hydrolyzing), partial [Polyangiales bacterium]